MQAKDRYMPLRQFGMRSLATRLRPTRATGQLASWWGVGILMLIVLLVTSPYIVAQPPEVGGPPQPTQNTNSAPTQGPIIVGDLIIQGNRLLSTEFIRNQMQTRVGQPFNPEVLQEDVRRLYSTKQFGNVYADKVDMGLVDPANPSRGRKIKVIVYIRDYPSVVEKITYRGNVVLRDTELDEITGLRKGMPCNPVANKVACQRIVQRYHEEGRALASCELIKGGEPGDTEVIFNITEGRKLRIKNILFKGQSFSSAAVLKTHLQSSGRVLGLDIGNTFNPSLLERDQNELLRYYRSFGYHDARIGKELIYDPDGVHVTVVFHIHEGIRYRVAGTPQVDGVRSVPPESLEAHNKLKEGQFFNQSVVDGDLARIRDNLGYQGREAQVGAQLVFPPDKPGIVQVRYEVEERPPSLVGQIFIVGNERTRQNVILRQVPLYPGQVLQYPAIREGERNLARLNIFETTPDGLVKPTITVLDNPADPNSPYKDILINVQETSTGSLMFGLGVNSDVGLTGTIVLNERNFDLFRLPTSFDDLLNGAFRGGGQELRIEAVPGTQLQRYMISLREPFLFDTPWSLTTSGYFFQRIYNEYSEDRLGGRFTLGRRISDYWSILGSVRLENVTVRNVPWFAPQDYLSVQGDNFLAGFRASAVRDSRDSLIRPTEGSLIDLSFEQVTGKQTYPLATAEWTQYWTAYQRADGGGRQVLSLHNMVGFAGSNTPVFERYFAGGFRSMRGFQFRGVGPDIGGFKVGGDFILINSLEYQIPVVANEQINLVGFIDGGTVASKINEIDKYRVSVGFGLRFVVPMLGPMPIALDFGFPIVSAATDNKQVFNFFMGWTR
jgi:outer membrane protein insertion porin family